MAAVLLLAPLVLSMRARLHVGGRRTGIPLPWALLDSLPLLESAKANRIKALLATLFAGPAAGRVRRPVLGGWSPLGRGDGAGRRRPPGPGAAGPAGWGKVPVLVPAFFTGPEVERASPRAASP